MTLSATRFAKPAGPRCSASYTVAIPPCAILRTRVEKHPRALNTFLKVVFANGKSAEATLTLEPGNYLLTCFVPGADHVPHIAKGMSRALTVASPR